MKRSAARIFMRKRTTSTPSPIPHTVPISPTKNPCRMKIRMTVPEEAPIDFSTPISRVF